MLIWTLALFVVVTADNNKDDRRPLRVLPSQTTTLEGPKESQPPTVAQQLAPSSSRWPTLEEVITNAVHQETLKPSASLLDMLRTSAVSPTDKVVPTSDDESTLQSEATKKKRKKKKKRNKKANVAVDMPTAAALTSSTTSTSSKQRKRRPSTVPVSPSSSSSQEQQDIDMPDLGLMDYAWEEDNIKIDFMTVDDLRRLVEKAGGKFETSLYSQSATHVASLTEEDKLRLGLLSTTPQTTTTVTVETTTTSAATTTAPTSGSWVPSLSNYNLTVSSSQPESSSSTPYPPLTLSLGSWQITEEDLPIYVGSAAGVLLLIIILMGVTTWRCCLAPSAAVAASRKRKEEHGTSPQNNNGHHALVTAPPDSENSDLHGHESMVCLTGSRVESRIVASPGSSGKRKDGGSPIGTKQSPSATLTHRKTTPFDVNTTPKHGNLGNNSDDGELTVVANGGSPGARGTYVRVPPVDNFVSTSNGATTFHTFQPRINGDKNSTGSSPDEGGFVCTIKGSSLSTPGTVRSTPSSEALDLVPDLRNDRELRFRSLPNRNSRNSNSKDAANGNLPSSLVAEESILDTSHSGPSMLNGNASVQNVEDLYAKVDFHAKMKGRGGHDGGQVAVVSPLPLHRIAQAPQPVPPAHLRSPPGPLLTFSSDKLLKNGNNVMVTSSAIVTTLTDVRSDGDDVDDDDSDKVTHSHDLHSCVTAASSRLCSQQSNHHHHHHHQQQQHQVQTKEDDPSLFYNVRTSL